MYAILSKSGLKASGVDDGTEGDNEDVTTQAEKDKLWKRHQERRARQERKHRLTRAMLADEVVGLFASRRKDGIATGFNCAVCVRDVSMLTHGKEELYRHFKRDSHYLKDRRHRFDHEDAIYTRDRQRVPIEEISDALRAEILETEEVTLGEKYPLEGEAVVVPQTVPGRIPANVLLNSLFELLRSGGSHSFLRRLWVQYRTALGEQSALKDTTLSKTETIVSISWFVLGSHLLGGIEDFV